MLAGLIKITLSRRAHQVKDRDFVTINDQPSRIETTTFFSLEGCFASEESQQYLNRKTHLVSIGAIPLIVSK
jgi:hypothetical protein